MYKRAAIAFVLFVIFYIGVVQFQVIVGRKSTGPVVTEQGEEKPGHKVYVFSFTKYTPAGDKEIEIEGDSADIFAKTVNLLNVVAKAYAQEVPVTITADKGSYDKARNKVHLNENVIATTEDGTRLLTEELDIHPSDSRMETEVQAEVKKDNINIEGKGAEGDSKLKKVKFKKNVTVVIKDDGGDAEQGPTVITCDGPLDIDYDRNIAYFQNNVVAEDDRGTLIADRMDVYYSKMNKRVAKIIAIGNVIIENPDGNTTYSDNVIYLAEEGRIILGGDTEALYYGGEKSESMEWSEVFN